MATKISMHEFVKDGLIGLVVAFSVYCVCLIISFSFELYPFTFESFWALIRISFVFPRTALSFANGIPNWHVFNSPMPLIILTTFLAVGSSGRLFKNINVRVSWIKSISIVVIKSWLIGAILWPVLLVVMVRLWVGSYDAIDDSAIIPVFFGTVGAIVGLLIGCGAGLFLNPSRQLFRIVIGASASICVTYVIGAAILLEQWLH